MLNSADVDPAALALIGIVVSLLNKLEGKGIFTAQEIRDLLDMSLTALESSNFSGPNQELARKYLDQLIDAFSPNKPA